MEQLGQRCVDVLVLGCGPRCPTFWYPEREREREGLRAFDQPNRMLWTVGQTSPSRDPLLSTQPQSLCLLLGTCANDLF